MTLLGDYLLAVYVVAGLIAAALLGAGIGSSGLSWAVRRATRRADAERDAAWEQLALAEEALDRATHPITSTGDRPQVDDLDAVARAVTDPAGRALSAQRRPVEDSEAWVWVGGERL